MEMVGAVLLGLIVVLLVYIGRILNQIRKMLMSAKIQIEDYLRIVWETTEEEQPINESAQVSDDEKKMLWNMEDRERLFNDVLQEIFQQ